MFQNYPSVRGKIISRKNILFEMYPTQGLSSLKRLQQRRHWFRYQFFVRFLKILHVACITTKKPNENMSAKETMQQQNNGITHMCAYAMFFLFISSFLLCASFLHHRINQLSVILCCFVIVAFFISLLFSVSQPNVARYMSFERKKNV